MPHYILFVDDEKSVLSALQRTFYEEDVYEFSFADSGEKGLLLLKEKPAAVIISDMRMPVMDGVAFLKKAGEICPDAVRLVLSAYADIDSIMQAVNEGHVWRYITKPWSENDLKIAIKNSIEYYEKSIEMQRLLIEVEKKNAQLKDMNTMLEDRVRERTIQLQERNELLHMIIDNKPLDEVMKNACAAVSRTIGGKDVFITAQFSGECFGDGKLDEDLRDICERTAQSRKNHYEEKAVGIALLKSNVVVGVIGIRNNGTISPFRVSEVEDSFGPIITMVLSHHRTLRDMPELMEKLDELSGEL